MKKVCFLLPDVTLKPTSLFSAIEIFEKANDYFIQKGDRPFYDVKIAGMAVEQPLLNSHFVIRTDSIYDIPKPDLIIIPGIQVMNQHSIKQNKELIDWLREQHQRGAELASMCTGAFLLAATDLVNEKECSTHWKAENDFKKMFPNVHLRIDKIITDNGGIYTAGGAISSLNLMVYLIEKYNGREVAVYCAKVLQIDLDRNSQLQFVLFEGQKNHDDDEIKKVQLFIEKNLDERITVESLSDRFAIAKRSLVRRFKKATNNPPIEYIQRIKIEAAKRKLEQKRKTVNEIMYSVGYTDVKAFRNVFKRITGLSPIDYRNKFAQLDSPEVRSVRRHTWA
jgi:transcriptional regulator GlxA family with amidase domain